MTRKAFFAYAALFFVSAVAVLAVVNPPLMLEPLGFAGIFLPLLAGFLLIHWAIRRWHGLARGTFNGLWLTAMVLGFTGIGFFGWGLMAFIISLLAMCLVKSEPKPVAAWTQPTSDIERAARQEFPWENAKGGGAR